MPTVNESALKRAARILRTTPIANTFDTAGRQAYLTTGELVWVLSALGKGTNGTYDTKALNDYKAVLANGGIPGSTLLSPGPHHQNVSGYFASTEKVLRGLGIKNVTPGANPHSGDPGFTEPSTSENSTKHLGSIKDNTSAELQKANVPTQAANAITSIPDFLGKLTSSGTWIRVAEVVGGAVVLFIAVDKGFGGGATKKLVKTGALL